RRPEEIIRRVAEVKHETYENVTKDLPEESQAANKEHKRLRKGDLTNMDPDGKRRVRLYYNIPARGKIGIRNEFQTLTNGAGI
ncbi:translational GTPase TypA, partial [Pseudomonas syringae pv. tagetis]